MSKQKVVQTPAMVAWVRRQLAILSRESGEEA